MRFRYSFSFLVAMAMLSESALAGDLPRAAAETVGMNAETLQQIDAVVAAGLKAKRMPGCVVAVGRRGKVVWLKASGEREAGVPMTVDTVFDLASLTKPVATACSTFQLIERGTLSLDDPVGKHLPAFKGAGKAKVTIRHLLTHTSGLAPANSMAEYTDGPAAALKRMQNAPLRKPVGTYAYSDIGFILLGEVVERRSGKSLDVWTETELFRPLGLKETGYTPPPELAARCAPTQKRRGEWMRGDVHDPRAWALDGVAGHAGLFSTANELARFAQMLLNEGELDGVRVLVAETVRSMTKAEAVRTKPERLRALGWDAGPGSSNRSALYSERAFGHGGFTGTGLWIDPEHELFVIFLSNRVHPAGKGSVNNIIGEIGGIAVCSLGPAAGRSKIEDRR